MTFKKERIPVYTFFIKEIKENSNRIQENYMNLIANTARRHLLICQIYSRNLKLLVQIKLNPEIDRGQKESARNPTKDFLDTYIVKDGKSSRERRENFKPRKPNQT